MEFFVLKRYFREPNGCYFSLLKTHVYTSRTAFDRYFEWHKDRDLAENKFHYQDLGVYSGHGFDASGNKIARY